MGLPTIVLDFDGVIHSYKSGWKGPRIITDPVVPGAMEFLYYMTEYYNIAISSSRSHYFGGRRAMKKYIKENLKKYIEDKIENNNEVNDYALNDEDETILADDIVKVELNTTMACISFPKYKPPAIITIDDRAIQFKGKWPTASEIDNFKPWNK